MDTNMGRLKPGATYVYERVDNRIYAREIGQTDREMVGWTHTPDSLADRGLRSEINQVLLMCETDPVMNELLEQLLIMYNLKKNNHE